MENFGEFLELVDLPGKEFGAIQVKASTREKDGGWWKRDPNGSITKNVLYTRSNLLPTAIFNRHRKNPYFTN